MPDLPGPKPSNSTNVPQAAETEQPADVGGYSLKAITAQPFTAKAERDPDFTFGAISTTDICNLECVMCHFNGPNAVKKSRQLTQQQVRKVLDQIPAGSQVYLAAGGDFFMDPHAEDHVEYALSRGLVPVILSHGQLYPPDRLQRLLHMGVRDFRISCDSIDAEHYAKIRRGGQFQNILNAIDYLNQRRSTYTGIRIDIHCTIFRKTFGKQQEFVDFWRGMVDGVTFNAEYYDTWHFRNIFSAPKERKNCKINTYVQPSGKITPCCALGVHQHENDLDWLPTVDTHTIPEAYQYLCDLYDDPNSPLAELCKKCDWWIVWAPNADRSTP